MLRIHACMTIAPVPLGAALSLYALQPDRPAPSPPSGAASPVPEHASPSTGSVGAPSGGSGASNGPGGLMGALFPFLIVVPFIALFWWQNRTQQKKQKELESKLKKGDRVLTQSGLIGKIVEISSARTVKLEIAPGVKVEMLKTSLLGVEGDASPTAKSDAPPAAEKKS